MYNSLHDDPTRTTPVGMARYAELFLEAAYLAFRPRSESWPLNDIASPPVMFLLGQSMELSLKAFLLAKGVTLRQLKSKDFGHSLHASMRKAKELGLLPLVSLSEDEKGALSALDLLYSTKQLQYIVTGSKQIPSYELLASAARKLVLGVSIQVGHRPRSTTDAA